MTRRRSRVGGGLTVAVLLWALSASPAFGHAEVVATAPTEQSVLDAMPSVVGVAFNETVRVLADSLALRRSDGTEVALGALPAGASTTLVQAPIPAGTAHGDFLVQWRVIGADDDHVMSGSFAFTVHKAPTVATAESVTTAPTTTPSIVGPATTAPFVARIATGVAATSPAPTPPSMPLAAPFVLGGLAAVGAMSLALLSIRRNQTETI